MKIKTALLSAFIIFYCFTVNANSEVSPLELNFGDLIFVLNFDLHPEILSKQTEVCFANNKCFFLPNPAGKETISKTFEFLNIFPVITTTDFYKISIPELKHLLQESSILFSDGDEIIEIDQIKNQYIIKGEPRSGYKVDFVLLEKLINFALEKNITSIKVPYETQGSKILTSSNIKAPKFRARHGDNAMEILGIGRSTFTNSPKNREKNIRNGLSKLNGTIIRSGKTFSFLDNIGPISIENGFVSEKIITGSRLSYEIGGGVCQVSSVVFRAGIASGLQISARKNHSFAISYYKPIGLDSMIYPAQSDLLIKNDTSGDILIQTFVKNSEAFVVFYGNSKTKRETFLRGPIIKSLDTIVRSQIIPSELLKNGEMQIAETSAPEAEIVWEYTRKIGKQSIQQNFQSSYRRWNEKVLLGTKKEKQVIAGG